MRASTQSERYTRVAIALHWAIAVCIIFNLSIGFFMEGWEQPWRGKFVGLHISFGMTALALTVLRVLWRLTHKPPPFSSDMKPWETRLAHLVHFILYFMMVAMPITGWSIISAHPPRPGSGANVFGMLLVPPLGPVSKIADVEYQKVVHDQFVELHEIGGWIMVALLVLHVAAALKHQFIDRHSEFARMGVGS